MSNNETNTTPKLATPLLSRPYLNIKITQRPLLILIHRSSLQNDFNGSHQNLPIMQSNLNKTDESEVHFIATSERKFNGTPYPWPSEVGSNILRAHKKDNFVSFLLVRPTGGGKTLVFNTLAACLKGVTLCISPLLSLGADQT